jgi:Tfp pilus assembly protein PilF
MADWQAAMATRLDFPETHLQMAGIALTMRDMRSAYSAFSEVVRLDPQRSEAWVMLVRIADAAGGAAAAGEVLSQALEFVPQDAELLALRNSLQGNAAVPAPQDLLPPALD